MTEWNTLGDDGVEHLEDDGVESLKMMEVKSLRGTQHLAFTGNSTINKYVKHKKSICD
ncbi:MAG: hypothetical protein ACJAS1_006527 [Oleiphilaceae bacterium]|jgi:hypothetical protein